MYFELTRLSVDVADNQWLGFGFGQNMTNTDIILCAVMDGEPFCYDCKGFSNGTPVLDSQQDVILYRTYFERGVGMSFSIK